MVFVLDEGSVFDMPMGKLWEYLPSEAHRHPSTNLISREVKGNVVTITNERNINGTMVRTKFQNTLYPPVGLAQEFIEGPAAGSRAFIYYSPIGDKTSITVVGDFKIAGASDDESVRKAVMQMLELSFNEDTETIKNIK
ncbi:MAG: hypothetical protein OK455_08715 [Thaumarchaeota archaeon]|nr:hypothetical protein [Nitrososphaerota archaeon]